MARSGEIVVLCEKWCDKEVILNRYIVHNCFLFGLFQNLWMLSVVLLHAGAVSGFEIWFISPIDGKSYWFSMKTIVETVLARHDHITTPILSNIKSENLSEVSTVPPRDMNETVPQKYNPKVNGGTISIDFLATAGDITENRLENSNFGKYDIQTDIHLNLVIIDHLYIDSIDIFVYKSNTRPRLLTICKYQT